MQKFPVIIWDNIWRNLLKSFLPTDWRVTWYLVMNDAIANAFKMQQHRMAQNGTICCMCNNVDDNVHRIKRCRGSGVIWSWLTRTLKPVLRLDFDDPEELFSRRLTLVEEAGLWYVAAAVHYNINNYENGTVL
jgi:hypothetical protein